MLTASSFVSARHADENSSSPSAMPRTITVIVCVMPLPPMPATIGMNAASATDFSIVPSNIPITSETGR